MVPTDRTTAPSQNDLLAFARRLTAARKAFGSRAAFARAIGITRTTQRALENAQQTPSADTLEKLAPYGVSLDLSAHPLLEHLTEEDLQVAQMFHHADLAVKTKVLGALQARQTPTRTGQHLAPDVATVAEQLLSLTEEQRYAASVVISTFRTTPAAAAATATPDALGETTRLKPAPVARRRPPARRHARLA